MVLTDSRRLLALSYHHFPEQARGSVFRVRGLTGNSFDGHFFFFAAHFSAAFCINRDSGRPPAGKNSIPTLIGDKHIKSSVHFSVRISEWFDKDVKTSRSKKVGLMGLYDSPASSLFALSPACALPPPSARTGAHRSVYIPILDCVEIASM